MVGPVYVLCVIHFILGEDYGSCKLSINSLQAFLPSAALYSLPYSLMTTQSLVSSVHFCLCALPDHMPSIQPSTILIQVSPHEPLHICPKNAAKRNHKYDWTGRKS